MGFSGILHTELIHFNWIISLQGEYFHSLIEIAPALWAHSQERGQEKRWLIMNGLNFIFKHYPKASLDCINQPNALRMNFTGPTGHPSFCKNILYENKKVVKLHSKYSSSVQKIQVSWETRYLNRTTVLWPSSSSLHWTQNLGFKCIGSDNIKHSYVGTNTGFFFYKYEM